MFGWRLQTSAKSAADDEMTIWQPANVFNSVIIHLRITYGQEHILRHLWVPSLALVTKNGISIGMRSKHFSMHNAQCTWNGNTYTYETNEILWHLIEGCQFRSELYRWSASFYIIPTFHSIQHNHTVPFSFTTGHRKLHQFNKSTKCWKWVWINDRHLIWIIFFFLFILSSIPSPYRTWWH